jgi:hypothetical protein
VLDAKERPGNTLLPSAMCIGWLQEGLDYMHTRYPWGSTLLEFQITWVAGQTRYDLPDDFIQDYQDGIMHANDEGRMDRKGLSQLLDVPSQRASTWGQPAWYCIAGSELVVRPAPSAQWAGKQASLFYYGMPTPLSATQKPKFPSDIVLTRYIWLRGLEWTRAVQPGTAEKYLLEVVSDLQRAGIGNEAEPDTVPLDRNSFPGVRAGEFAWMGPTTVSE